MKHLLTLITAATLSSTLVQADAQGRMNKRNHSSQSEKPACSSRDDKYGPCLRQGFFITADFLYWIAHQEGLEYATTGIKGLDNAVSTSVARGSAKQPNFKWKPGFRVGLGWTLPNSYWDLSANWTWYHSTAHNSVTHSGDRNLNPLYPTSLFPSAYTLAGINSPGTLSAASSKWRLCYNVLDFELGRSFFPNKHLSVRPHAGVRGAWINQHNSNNLTFVDVSDTAVISRKIRNDYRAGGFKTGVDSLWHFNRYWGIFANTSVSLLGGNFRIKETDTTVSNTDASSLNINFLNTTDRLFSVVPVLETAMGFHLMLAPDRRHYWFDLNAGWEYTVWFNQNQMALYTNGAISNSAPAQFIRERANLHLMGFTLNAKLHF